MIYPILIVTGYCSSTIHQLAQVFKIHEVLTMSRVFSDGYMIFFNSFQIQKTSIWHKSYLAKTVINTKSGWSLAGVFPFTGLRPYCLQLSTALDASSHVWIISAHWAILGTGKDWFDETCGNILPEWEKPIYTKQVITERFTWSGHQLKLCLTHLCLVVSNGTL